MVYNTHKIHRQRVYILQIKSDTTKFKLIACLLSKKNIQQYNFSNLEFRIKEAKNIIPKCTFPENCYTDLIQIQLSSLTLYTQKKKHRFHYRSIIIILSVGALSFYHTNVSHNLLELQKERFPPSIPLYRKVSYVWNAAFGMLFSVVSYKE